MHMSHRFCHTQQLNTQTQKFWPTYVAISLQYEWLTMYACIVVDKVLFNSEKLNNVQCFIVNTIETLYISDMNGHGYE